LVFDKTDGLVRTDFLALDDFSKDDVFPVYTQISQWDHVWQASYMRTKVRGRDGRDEELGAYVVLANEPSKKDLPQTIGVRTSIGHGQQEGLRVLHRESLVPEFQPIDGFT
jgi:hypothetical protein